MADEIPRGGNGGFIRVPETAEQDAEVARLRARGLSYVKIQRQMGFASVATAYRSYQRALAAIIREPTMEARETLLQQLDDQYLACIEILEHEHLMVSHGKIVQRQTPDGPITLHDDGPKLAALAQMLRINESKRKLLGSDAPRRTDVFTFDGLTSAVSELEKEIESLGGSVPRRATPS